MNTDKRNTDPGAPGLDLRKIKLLDADFADFAEDVYHEGTK